MVSWYAFLRSQDSTHEGQRDSLLYTVNRKTKNNWVHDIGYSDCLDKWMDEPYIAHHHTEVGDVLCSCLWATFWKKPSFSIPRGHHWRTHTSGDSISLPPPCGSIRSAAGLVQGRGTVNCVSLFLLTPFLSLESLVRGPPWWGQSSSNSWPLPKSFDAAPDLSPLKSKLLELDQLGSVMLWATSAGSLSPLFSSQHHTSKGSPFLVTWLDRPGGSSLMAFPTYFSNSNY